MLKKAPFSSAGAVDGFDFQALAVRGQFLSQSLIDLPSSARRMGNIGLGLPVFSQLGNTANASSIRSAPL